MKYFLTFILIISIVSENQSQDKKENIDLKDLGWHGIYTNLNMTIKKLVNQIKEKKELFFLETQ